jgi:hypothetical protein
MNYSPGTNGVRMARRRTKTFGAERGGRNRMNSMPTSGARVEQMPRGMSAVPRYERSGTLSTRQLRMIARAAASMFAGSIDLDEFSLQHSAVRRPHRVQGLD